MEQKKDKFDYYKIQLYFILGTSWWKLNALTIGKGTS